MDPAKGTAAFTAELIEAIADGVSVVSSAGQHLLVNEAFCAMTGYSRDELLALKPGEWPYWPPEEVEHISAAFKRMLAGDYGPYDLIFCRKSGERFPCSVFPGRATADGAEVFIATIKDLSEEHRDRDRMAELTRLLENMTHAGDLATWEWDILKDEVRVSSSWFTQLGDPPGPEIITTGTMAGRVHPDDFPATQREIEALLANQTRLYEVEHRVRMAGGEYRWFLARGFITERDDEGRPLKIGGTNQDIHRFKLQEEHLRQYQKMEVLGQITGGIAHDFNNLLQVLYGNLSELTEGRPDDREKDLEAMEDALDRATNLTRSLLRYVRKQQPSPERVDVDAFIRQAEGVLITATSSVVHLRLDLDEPLHAIEIEPSAMENALLNLVVNARDAARQTDGGTVVISTGFRTVNSDEAILLNCAPGAYVTVSVADNGVGMTEDVLARATEPLFTTRGTGTGLGLSMVLRFVRQAGGFLHMESTPGEGTTVLLGFPAHATAADRAAQMAQAKGNAVNGSLCVLLVDDEGALLESLAPGLQNMGFEVLTAENPRKALETLDRNHIDVLVTDIAMPYSLNGIGLAHRVRSLRPDIPVLFMTGFATPAMEEEAKTLGPVMWKPFSVGELANRIRKLTGPMQSKTASS